MEKQSEELKKMTAQMIHMECAALDKEIRDLIIQGQHLRINLNSNDLDQIVQQIDGFRGFLKDLAETCDIQTLEVRIHFHLLEQCSKDSISLLKNGRKV